MFAGCVLQTPESESIALQQLSLVTKQSDQSKAVELEKLQRQLQDTFQAKPVPVDGDRPCIAVRNQFQILQLLECSQQQNR